MIAVDWSGARGERAQRRHIVAAAVSAGTVELWTGLTRDEVVDRVIGLGGQVVAGFDFSFAFPAWFARRLGASSAPELWELVLREGERWLSQCEPPFFGRAGSRRPPDAEQWRETERWLGAKSTFQIGGPGAPGTGSVRGMPLLARLRDAGFAIWPFDAVSARTVVEIYPSALVGRAHQRSATTRRSYLDAQVATGEVAVPAVVHAAAVAGPDTFDALASALVMWRHRDDFPTLLATAHPVSRIEGVIWAPRVSGT